jgi:ATP-dependent protease ClpP protease subunit
MKFMRPVSKIRQSKRWYEIRNADQQTAEVLIYDEIGMWGTTADQFVRDLSQIKAATIEVRINSPGGDVFDAVAIYNALRNHGSKIVTQVDGLAASAASLIFMAGDEREMGAGTFLMIHDPWSICMGPADELRKTADMLDQVCDSIAGIYARANSDDQKDAKYFAAKMAKETWYSAEDAVAEGLADRVGDPDQDDDQEEMASNRFDLSRFKNAPAALKTKRNEPNPSNSNANFNIELKSRRDAERFLCDAGLPRAAAKKAAGPLCAALALSDRRDADDAELESIGRQYVTAVENIFRKL